MGTGFQGAVLRALGAKNHAATVTGTRWITDHVVRIEFQCDGILYADGEKPSAWIRAWFPDPDGGSKFHQRGYTLVDPDPVAGTFGIFFLVHEPAGPASSWARDAAPGDELLMTRLGGDGYDLGADEEDEEPPRGYLLMGDVAAWPAICSVIARVPSGMRVRAVIEYSHDDDRSLPMPDHDALEVNWVPSTADRRALADAIGDDDYRSWKTWVTAETKATRLAKSVLALSHEQNKATMHTQAYWAAGRAMGKQIDTAEEQVLDEPDVDDAAPARATRPEPETTSVLRPALPALILAGFVALLLVALEVVPLVLFAELARRLVDGAGRSELVDLAVVAVSVLLAGTILGTVAMTVLHLYDQAYAAALRRRVLDKLTRLPLGWFMGRRSAEVRGLVVDDVSALHYLVTHAVPDIVAAVVTPLAILIYLFTVNWVLALALLVPVIAYVVGMARVATGDRPRLERMLRWNATLPGDAERFVAGQQVSRVFGDAATFDLPAELRRYSDFVKQWQRESVTTKAVVMQFNKPITSMVVVATVGTALITLDVMPATAILPFLILGTSFSARLLAASYAIDGLRGGLNGKSSLELLLTANELEQASAPVDGFAEAGPAGVELRAVRFGYSPGRPVLDGFDLSLPAGKTTALVGPSGSGKSTVAALVARLWDPEDGAVLIDGVDVRDVPEEQLRTRVAAVLQDVQLVRGTVADNIALGVSGGSRESIREAARAAFIDEVIEALPDGYDTMIDRDSLSGGQRQRIAIARALLGDPRVVVLDEATAAADPDSEWEVRQGLSRLLAGRTVLVVAHRLHTIADADQIVVLDGGRIRERGTGADLLAAGDMYAAMTAQAQEALR